MFQGKEEKGDRRDKKDGRVSLPSLEPLFFLTAQLTGW
jgi:hypothetical protein